MLVVCHVAFDVGECRSHSRLVARGSDTSMVSRARACHSRRVGCRANAGARRWCTCLSLLSFWLRWFTHSHPPLRSPFHVYRSSRKPLAVRRYTSLWAIARYVHQLSLPRLFMVSHPSWYVCSNRDKRTCQTSTSLCQTCDTARPSLSGSYLQLRRAVWCQIRQNRTHKRRPPTAE
jgi:hypothetical protein